MTLAGTNSYTGTTTISGGTLQFGNGVTVSLASSNVVNNGALEFNGGGLTYGGVISGTGTVTKNGAGTVAITGANTYTGATTINVGTLEGLINNNATLTVAAAATFNEESDSTVGSLAGAGTVNLNATTFTVGGANTSTTFTGTVAGAGSLTKTGTGTLALAGTNSYTGTTTISGGTLQVGNGVTVSLGSSNVVNNGALEFNGGGLTYGGVISGTGMVIKSGVGTTLTLSGANTYTGATTVNAGTLQAGAINVFGSNSAVTVSGGATLDLNGNNQAIGSLAGAGSVTLGAGTLTAGANNSSTTYSGVMSGTGGLIKQGAGTLTLSGANIYSGGTTINGGALAISGTTGTAGTGTIVVDANTLDVINGASVANAVTINGGTLTNSTGSGTVAVGGVTLGGNSTVSSTGAGLTISAAIGESGGSFGLTKTGAGTVTLSGVNSYSGATTINAGALAYGASNVIGTGTVTVNGATAVLDLGSNQSDTVGTVTVANGGRITGMGTSALTSTGTFEMQSGSVSAILAGAGIALNKTTAGTVTLSGANTYTGATTINAGTLAVNGSTTSNTTINSGGTLGGTGMITGAVIANSGGTLAPGNSIGTITVDGNVTVNAGSTFRAEIDPGAADRINVIGAPGTATLNGGTVDVRAMAGIYQPGTSYTILNATGGVAGTFSGATSNFAFLTPTLTYNANNVFLALAQTVSFTSAAVTPNQRAVAGALDATSSGATGDFSTVINAVSSLLAGQAGAAFDSMGGQMHGTVPMIALTNGTTFARTLTGRIGQMQPGTEQSFTGPAFSNLMLAAADTGTMSDMLPAAGVVPTSARLDDDRGVWIRGYGVSGNLGGDGNAVGADYHLAGTVAGADRLINDRLLVGAGAGYMRTRASLSGLGDGTTVQSYQAGTYGSYAEGPWMLKAILRYAYNSYDTTRSITIGTLNRTATGDYGGHEGSVYAEAGYNVVRGNTTLQPVAAVQYTHLRQNGFTEQGAGSLNLRVDRSITQSLRSLLGPRLTHVVELKGDRTIKVEGRALWSHEWSDTNSSITTRFAGAPAGGDFTVTGVNVGRDGAVLGAGAMATFSSSFSVFTDYNTEVRNRQTEHQAVGGLRWSW